MTKIEKHDQEYIKQKNKSMILDIIKNQRPISRADIAKMTGMSPTSVSRIVGELCSHGFVKETEPYSNGVGRKAVLLDIYLDSVLTIGIYLNRDIIRLGIVDFDGHIIEKHDIQFNSKGFTPEMAAKRISEEINITLKTGEIDTKKIIGIGIGMPGIIDFKRGIVDFSAQLGWGNANIAKLIEDRLNIRTTIDNSVKLKALSESLYGAARGSKKAALISIDNGVGSALIINGEIFRGDTNRAGELGHTTVDPYGILCDCGRRGCLQTYIAEGALIQEANKVKPVSSVKEIIDAAINKESWAINILERATTYISIAINNVLCMYAPDTIILSGMLIDKYPELIDMIEEKCTQFIWEHFRDKFKLVYSKLKDDSVIIGAATLSLNISLNLDY